MSRRLRAPIDALTSGERELHGESLHYLTRVLRLRSGDTFTAFDPLSGLTAEVVVDEFEHGRFKIRIGEVSASGASEAAAQSITWIHGLPKGDKADSIVRDATELGATTIQFAVTRHGVPKMDAAKAESRLARWTKIAVEASRQAERPRPPEVLPLVPWAEAIGKAKAASAKAFLLHSRGGEALGAPLLAALADEAHALVFAAGPEGGFADDEVLAAQQAGFRVTTLGPLILRTETVPAAVLGALRVMASA